MLELAHFGAVMAWGGIVLAEIVLELVCRRSRSEAVAAQAHFWVDVTIELPTILLVLVTGVLLLGRVPITPLLWAKIAFASVAVGLNLFCAAVVVRRYRSRTDPARARSLTRQVFASIAGLPFALVALGIGLSIAN